jgi:hypothetical protein
MLAATWVGVLGTVVLLSSIVAGGAAAQPASCAKPAHLPAGSRDSKHKLLLTAREGDAITINFDDSRSRQAYPILLSANAGQLLPSDFDSSSGLQAGAGDYYISRDGQHRISVNTGDQMRALLIPINPHELQLCVIVQPNADGGVEPGRYKGTILIAHNGNQELLSVPIELTRWGLKIGDDQKIFALPSTLADMQGVARLAERSP